MALCIYGFPTNVAALQFEWAWQHPVESLAVRKAATAFKSLSGITNKIKLAYTMLTLPAWNSLNLTVNFFSTKYKTYTAGCPNLPAQMRIQVCSMDELPCYTGTGSNQNSCEYDECNGDDDFSTSQNQELLMGAASNHQSPSNQESSMGAATNHQSPSDRGIIPEKRRKQINHIEETRHERSCSEISWMGQQRNSPIETSSVTTGSYNIAGGIVDGHVLRLVEEATTELMYHPLENQSTTALVADEDPILMKSPRVNYEVEVIDVFTPSPCYRASSGRKKRRPNVYPEIIDLTDSPICL
ncbi:structure-specific endonuclease subunit SLX1 isoform X1 [Olea europaea subsp. europaea]|nr:structure-specific endonuclease subunit SLX1 isoform X1 [Olea europaea subsp. europaea]